ncbi:unnamed protein product [Phytophthora fragariaefolia]|uniref:Unnamed protein product n=1 Tax=Phytophthora fragariaefolia TaxID=1490495 RepID=A0A9W7D0U6_9STRA|nr:unnamed protein product [Phytophthora fragariaefolia]
MSLLPLIQINLNHSPVASPTNHAPAEVFTGMRAATPIQQVLVGKAAIAENVLGVSEAPPKSDVQIKKRDRDVDFAAEAYWGALAGSSSHRQQRNSQETLCEMDVDMAAESDDDCIYGRKFGVHRTGGCVWHDGLGVTSSRSTRDDHHSH